MANDFTTQVDVMFSKVVAGFEATNVSINTVSQYKASAGDLQQSNQAFQRPVPVQTSTVDGLDVSSSYKDLQELTVPTYLNGAHIRNVPLQLNGLDLNNERVMEQMVNSANIQLSNKLDTIIADKIAMEGTLAVVNSGLINTYDDAAEADALMLEQQATRSNRCMLLNARMAKNLAGDLGGRQTMNSINISAYERSQLPMIAGFDTFRVDYSKTLLGSAGTGYLVNGADQDYTPAAMNGDTPVDNRTQTLIVDTGTGAAIGDVFTIAGVYAVGHINKQSTGQLKTFRILGIAGANLTISPPIIPADGTSDVQKAYANVDTKPADNAAITILNTVTKPVSTFFEKDAIEIVHADFNLEPFRASGKKVRTGTTDSGLKISMLSDSNIDTFVSKYRMFIWANAELLNPELAGIMLESQT